MGNGPSSWWLTETSVRTLRREAGAIVLACNRVAIEVEADVAVALDDGVFAELAACRNQVSLLATGDRAAKRYPSPHEVLVLDKVQAGYSSGVAAIEVALQLGAPEITLVGFDGERDTRTRHAGTPNYRDRPTRPVAYQRWARRIHELALRAGPAVRWQLHAQPGPHALDSLPAKRVDLQALVSAGAATAGARDGD
jgi:hypothetical protein